MMRQALDRARDRLPRFLMLGDAALGKTTLLSHLGLHALGEPANDKPPETHLPCEWWRCEQGMILEIAGEVFSQADTDGDEDKKWQRLLRRLRRDRIARPLDGVIVTLSCTDLLRPATPGTDEQSRLKDKATGIAKRLTQAQREFGLRFPVYILITKCDQIHGFQSLCRNLPVPRHQDIFGWSNPYVIDTTYTSTWVDEAFQYLCQHLVQLQSDIFATCQELRDGDELFLFPTALQNLQEPLRVYLDQLFTSPDTDVHYFCRGLYFCGDGGGQSMTSPHLQPVFLEHLFTHKIFPEYGLARHETRGLTSARWKVRIAQALIALFILIDWQFTLGDKAFPYRGPQTPAQGRWSFGELVQFSLRWPKDGPVVPIAAVPPASRVKDRTIVYKETSPWSLLRFVQRHASAPRDFDQLVDPEPHTLAFTIATGAAEGQEKLKGKKRAASAPARAFIRVVVMPADKQERLVVPPFPVRAPSGAVHQASQH